jgi:small-conductance mechanosensitive channel
METRRKMNETNARTQIVTAALEKNPDMDVEEILKKVSRKPKLLKEKLLTKLLWGFITSLLGIGLIVLGIYMKSSGLGIDVDVQTALCFGLILLAIGAAFIINYGVGRKMLAKEIEAEESKTTPQS